MVNVCAWCERFLGIKEPRHNDMVTHGICPACFKRQLWEETPVLVVSREREHMVPVLTEMLRGVPEIQIVVERRQPENSGPYEGATRRQQQPIVVD
jgi:hypothetical protein